MSLAKAGIRGAYFTSLALGARQVVSLATTFYVARQLLPADLGVFSMVMVVIGFAQVVGDIGLATGLVRSQNNSSTVLSTCFWFASGIGLVLSLMVFFLAPLAAWFYEKPEIAPYVRMAGLGLFINFLQPVPMALLQQRLAYKSISIAQASGSLLGAVATVGLLYYGFGIWALVLQPIVGNLVMLLLFGMYSNWRPTLEFNLKSINDILTSGFHMLGGGLIGYARNNFDALVIGKSMPARDLGIYSMAQTILYAPMHLITSTVSRVLFPLLSKVQDDMDKLREAVLKATARTALLTFPIYMGLFVLADEFVGVVFGPNWLEMTPLIKLMMLSYMVQSITFIAGPVSFVMKKTKIMLQISFWSAAFYVAVLLVAMPYGLNAVAAGFVVCNVLSSILGLLINLYFAKIDKLIYLKSIIKPFGYALLMAIFVFFLKDVFQLNGVVNLISLALVGALSYAVLILMFEKTIWFEIKSAIFN